MDENRLFELVNDDEFIEQILDCSSREEMQQIFESNGKNISEKELDYLIEAIEKASQTAITICGDKSMDIVTGGITFDAIDDCLTRKLLFRFRNTDFDPI